MRPLQTIPHLVTISPASTPYLEVFIPANVAAFQKIMLVSARMRIVVTNTNPPGGPTYSEFYGIAGTGTVARGGAHGMIPAPSNSVYYMQRRYIIDGTGNLIELNWDVTENFAASSPDGLDHELGIITAGGPFNPNIDQTLQFILKTSNALSIDTIQVITAEAYIQAPLDLGRLPR